jgi:hypothetical protein
MQVLTPREGLKINKCNLSSDDNIQKESSILELMTVPL